MIDEDRQRHRAIERQIRPARAKAGDGAGVEVTVASAPPNTMPRVTLVDDPEVRLLGQSEAVCSDCGLYAVGRPESQEDGCNVRLDRAFGQV